MSGKSLPWLCPYLLSTSRIQVTVSSCLDLLRSLYTLHITHPHFFPLFLVFGSYPLVLRAYSWLRTQKSLLQGPGDHDQCQASNLGHCVESEHLTHCLNSKHALSCLLPAISLHTAGTVFALGGREGSELLPAVLGTEGGPPAHRE